MAGENIDQTSRLKDTDLLVDEDGLKFYDLWNRPIELDQFKERTTLHTVRSNELGRFDLLAHRFYGKPELWWIITAFNNIIDPITDVKVGQVIKIPQKQEVLKYVNRGTR